MSLKYGINITASDMYKYLDENERLQNGIRSWRQLFGNAGLRYNAQLDSLSSDYASAVAEAYKSNFERENAILNSGYNIGATNEFLADNRNDLMSAYDAYIRNYRKDASTIAANRAEEIGALDAELRDRADKFASLYNSVYDYLSEELAGSYQKFDEGATTIDYLTDQGLDWIRNDDGSLKTWTELSYQLFNTDDSTLTDAGKQFYNRIFNDIPQGWIRDDDKSDTGTRSMRGFDEWLSNTNPKLRDWWVSANEYGYVSGGRNKDVADKALGIHGMDPVDSSVKQPTNTSQARWQEGSNVPWTITGLGTGRKNGKPDRFSLTLKFGKSDVRTYAVKTVDNVGTDLAKKLNHFSTGGETTSPSTDKESWTGGVMQSTDAGKQNKIVVYENKMYIYTKNGWREVISNENASTQEIINAFLKKN